MQSGPAAEPHRWLSKTLADLTINDLATSERLELVGREQMQLILEEQRLAEVALIPRDSLDRLRSQLRIDYAVFGTYQVDGEDLTLQARLLRLPGGEVVAADETRGRVADLLQMQRDLSARLLRALHDPRPVAAIAASLPRWTDSADAARRYYEGLNDFDAGRYAQAWLAFRRALKLDPTYADAVYGVARMYYYRQMYDHARLAYENFLRDYPQHPRRGDALIEYVPSFEQSNLPPNAALSLYQRLRRQDWRGSRVHNQDDFVSHMPLDQWLVQREQQACAS